MSDFLNGKPQHTIELFNHLISEFEKIGHISLYPLKTMIGIGSVNRFAYIIQLGSNFIDVVFPFKQSYDDNLCFKKIKAVPASTDFNHHLRIYLKEDINEDLKVL